MARKKRQSKYTKPGKGIDANERKKNTVFRFFELLVRKITRLVILNILYLICILPLVCAVVTLGVTIFGISPEVVQNTVFVNIIMRLSFWIPTPLAIALVCISAIFYGPITCGFTYCMKNLAIERHVWYSDLFSKAKENFKQGIIIGFIDIIVFTSCALYLCMDISAVTGTMYYYYTILRILAVIISVFYVFMRYYLYTIIVSFYLPIKAILKNAYIFAVLGFGRNLLVTAIIILTVFSLTSTPYLDIFLTATFTFSFCGFLANYATYPIIKKYMLDVEEKVLPEPESEE